MPKKNNFLWTSEHVPHTHDAHTRAQRTQAHTHAHTHTHACAHTHTDTKSQILINSTFITKPHYLWILKVRILIREGRFTLEVWGFIIVGIQSHKETLRP